MSSGGPAESGPEAVLTPMMRQYLEVKQGLEAGTVLLFRLGDFYEMFFEDALRGSQILDITLTKRMNVPMAGIPHQQLDNYAGRFLAAGLKVAIAEQTEDAAAAKGLVRREVVRVLTPGTVTEENALRSGVSNHLACVLRWENVYALAVLELSTGSFHAGEFDSVEALATAFVRAAPAEALIPQDLWPEGLPEDCGEVAVLSRFAPPAKRAAEEARQILCRMFSVASLEGFGLEELPAACVAAAALVRYTTQSLHISLAHVGTLGVIRSGAYMSLDRASQRNLELVEPLFRDARKSTLLSVLDRTVTPMGARFLRKALVHPLLDLEAIAERQDAVAALQADAVLQAELRETLRGVRDVERILGRLSLGVAGPRDLQALGRALNVLPALHLILNHAPAVLTGRLLLDMAPEPALAALLERALCDEPPATVKEGGLIRDGYSEHLDRLRSAARDGRQWIARFEQEERQRSGIRSLKVGYNRVFGYFIELSKVQAQQAPAHYIRKQTMSGAERYITPELKEIEDAILGSDERALALEAELFQELRDQVLIRLRPLQQVARAIAQIDFLASLAEAARAGGYVRPCLLPDGPLVIRDGRHPVVATLIGAERFVPNDTLLGGEYGTVSILTGPNMAGKSTFIRQVALITLMAHVGSPVPASFAQIPLTRAIYTRIGASDDLSRGQSTFMVEMLETANILNNCKPDSLVILDEVGRGTSTWDGMSLAWAIAEHLGQNGARTLFATHYHELTRLSAAAPAFRNWNVAAAENGDQIVFLHKVQPGGADRSYGIQVARLAGLPPAVISRATAVLADLESMTAGAYVPSARPARQKPAIKDESPRLFDW